MRYEVAVVGAGPAGAVAAATLARQGRHVLLLDGGQRPGAFAGGESLPPLAPALRHELALGTVLASAAHLPCYGNAAAWGSAELQYQSFIRSPYGAGWHLDRPAFDAALREQAGAAGAQLLAGQLRALQPAARGGWHLHLQTTAGAQQTSAAWVLDCSGRRRAVSRQLGQPYQHHDRLVAYCQSYTLPTGAAVDEDRLTLVEAAPWGWGHSAGLPGGARAVTLFADAGPAATRQLGTAAGFAAALRALPQLAGLLCTHGYAPLGAPRATDARTGCLAQPVGAGWLAAGDAATAFDPLAAQGILAAVWAGHRAALALGHALAGDAAALPTYARQVQERFAHLRAQSRHFYGQERRWAHEPFWQARHQAAGARPPAFSDAF
jgi:flavin-dependent dehydrogenase